MLLYARIVCYSEKPLTFAERWHRKEDIHNIYAYIMLVSGKVKYSGHQVHCHLIANDMNLKAIKKNEVEKTEKHGKSFFFLPCSRILKGAQKVFFNKVYLNEPRGWLAGHRRALLSAYSGGSGWV